MLRAVTALQPRERRQEKDAGRCDGDTIPVKQRARMLIVIVAAEPFDSRFKDRASIVWNRSVPVQPPLERVSCRE